MEEARADDRRNHELLKRFSRASVCMRNPTKRLRFTRKMRIVELVATGISRDEATAGNLGLQR